MAVTSVLSRGQHAGHGDGMLQVGLSGTPRLPFMRFRRKIVGLAYEAEIGIGVIALHAVQQLIDIRDGLVRASGSLLDTLDADIADAKLNPVVSVPVIEFWRRRPDQPGRVTGCPAPSSDFMPNPILSNGSDRPCRTVIFRCFSPTVRESMTSKPFTANVGSGLPAPNGCSEPISWMSLHVHFVQTTLQHRHATSERLLLP